MNYRVNTHDAHRTEYQAMGFKIADIEKGGAMTKRNIDRHIENLSPFVKELQRAAFRAGAEAAREADCRAVCEFCTDGERAEYYAGEDRHPGGWTHNRLSGRTWCKASSIRALPLPEMEAKR